MDTIEWDGHAGKVICTRGEYKVIECNTCGFKHIIPLPNAEKLNEFYKHNYFNECLLQYILDKDEVWLESVYQDVYEQINDYMQCEHSNKRVLDIGTGHSLFLREGKKRGWEVLGIDPGDASRIFADKWGIDFLLGMWDKTIMKQVGKFSAIHFSEVLEHVVDPYEFLSLVKEALHVGGIAYMLLPNEFNVLQDVVQKQYAKDHWYVVPPEHINYFNHASLKKLLEKVGFEVVHESSTFPMEFFLLMGNDYIMKGEAGKPFHEQRMNFDKALIQYNKDFRRNLYNSFARLGIGREIVMFARKKG